MLDPHHTESTHAPGEHITDASPLPQAANEGFLFGLEGLKSVLQGIGGGVLTDEGEGRDISQDPRDLGVNSEEAGLSGGDDQPGPGKEGAGAHRASRR